MPCGVPSSRSLTVCTASPPPHRIPAPLGVPIPQAVFRKILFAPVARVYSSLGLPGFRKIKGSRWENIGEMVERAVGPDSPEEGDEASLRSLPLVPAETPMKKTVNSFLLGQTGPLTSFLVFFFSLLVEPWSCMKKKKCIDSDQRRGYKYSVPFAVVFLIKKKKNWPSFRH